MFPRPLIIGLTVLITIAWAANLTVGIVSPGKSDPALNAIFAIVVGAVFAFSRKSPGNGLDGESPGQNVRRRLADLIEPKPDADRAESDDRGDQV